MKVLITGSYGQLGSELKELSPGFEHIEAFHTDIDTLDITDSDAIERFIADNGIEIIINCAAYTAVDKAEDESEKAELINVTAVKNLLNIAQKYQTRLIHISTDYVFDGLKNTPYDENDPTNPDSVYGNTKLKAEQAIQESGINWMIIRTSWLYSSYGNNFVKTILRIGEKNEEIKVVFDQAGTPTYAKNLAEAILKILTQIELKQNNFEPGIYHFANEGVCSWYDFAIEILKTKKIDCFVRPVLSEEFPTKATRPYYSVLNKQKICRTYNLSIPHWMDGLKECLQKI